MQRVILGGGLGLCGSYLSRWLLDKGYEVIILDDLSESYIENLDKRAKFYLVDCCDFKKVDKIFEIEKPDYVFSMQAHAAEHLSPFCSLDNYQNNLLSVVSFKNACVKYNVKKHIVFSSFAVYGHQAPPFDEEMLPQPADNYSVAKYAVEIDTRLAKEQFGLDYSIVRPHNFQGPFLNFASMYRNFIGIAVREALSGRNIPVYSDGQQTRAFSHVKFLCEPLEKLMFTDCELVNLGAERPHKIIDVANIVRKIAAKDGKDVGIQHLPPRSEAVHAFCNHKIAREKLDFKDETDIEELCYDIYHWVKTQPPREVKKANYEIEKNLYSYWR